MGKCVNIWHRKDKHLWIPLIVDFMDLWNHLKILKTLLTLYYLENWCKIFLTRNGFEDFENIADIWLFKYFMKLFGSGLCISNTLTCEFLMWFCHFAMILVIIPSLWWCLCDDPIYVTITFVWLPRLCDDNVCVTTSFVWRQRLCDDPICVTTPFVWWHRLCDDLVLWPWVRFLILK